jgi:glycosyltransferase involved in cell wall biosynthesis
MPKTIWIVDIEGIDSRYTKQWRHNIPKIFEKETGLNVQTISGTDYSTLTGGGFFNFALTMKYKAEQQEKIAVMLNEGTIKDGDYIFYSDAFTPTVMATQYIINMTDRNIKQYGYIHTNSYDNSDILGIKGNNHWAKHFEKSMFECLEEVYVATEYHLDQLLENFPEYKDKFIVSGCPTDLQELEKYSTKKEKIILFPHRINEDKQPQIFEALKAYFPDYKFVYTQETPLSKDEYYRLLAKSEIVFSFALHENYGIAMIESLFLGCKVIMPNDKSYKEMYDGNLMYDRELENNIELLAKTIRDILEDKDIDKYLENSKENIKENYCSFTNACKKMK